MKAAKPTSFLKITRHEINHIFILLFSFVRTRYR